ncbi:MAG: metalloregulator ArsR/SmtB family transcription factor, partial [Proteobacteria bacterium]|nr:metalloregulator ArsR/SmtB family transcription factor [Pseudomonadota bacterium]
MSPSRPLKNAVYAEIGRLGKALASPARLEILDLLSQGPKTVEAVAQGTGLAFANASQHLKVLRLARMIEAEKHGTYVEYRLASPEVADFLLSFRKLAETRLTEIERLTRAFSEDRSTMERLEPRSLLQRVQDGVILLDVRPADEYRAGHLPGAVSIPVTELQKRLAELPMDRDVVAYCRGPYCLMAVEAVTTLRKKGYSANRSEIGVPE